MAAEMIAGGDEKVRITVGGVLAQIDSSVGINGTTNAGSIIDLDGPTGNKDVTNIFVGADWRLAPRHRLSALYFTTKKERSLSFDRTITVGDDTLIPPTTLDSESRNRFLFATYRYSFVKNPNLEISGLIGAYLNKFSADISGTATVSNSQGQTTVTRTVDYRPSVTIPMPLVGASVNWYASPRINLSASLSGLKAKIGDVDGSVYVATVGGEYMFTRNIGAGVSFMHTDVDVDVTKRTFEGTIDWKNDNFLGYVVVKF